MTRITEIERKFLVVSGLDLDELFRTSVAVSITQHYWEKMRMRKTEAQNGDITYRLTLKKTVGEGMCTELEKLITEQEYEDTLEVNRTGMRTLSKMRYTFPYGGHSIEVDIFVGTDLIYVEVELNDINEKIEFPPGWKLIDITGDERFTNCALSKLLSGT